MGNNELANVILDQDDWMLIDDSQKPSLNHTESLLKTIKGK